MPLVPFGNVKIAMENHHFIHRKTHHKWQFSIAMLNYQRVHFRTKGDDEGFHSHDTQEIPFGWFIWWKIHAMDDLGVPQFSEPPYESYDLFFFATWAAKIIERHCLLSMTGNVVMADCEAREIVGRLWDLLIFSSRYIFWERGTARWPVSFKEARLGWLTQSQTVL